MTHVTIERAKAQRIADAFEDLKKNHGMVYVEELVDINQALAEPILSAGPITPEMANWSEADKAKLVSVITQHAAPVQEPVAIVVAAEYEDGSPAGHRLEWRGRNEANDFPEGTKFYTTPPAAQQQWVSLTDDEILEVLCIHVEELDDPDEWAYEIQEIRAIEAKLRSKNGY